jgi:hypothetical protein
MLFGRRLGDAGHAWTFTSFGRATAGQNGELPDRMILHQIGVRKAPTDTKLCNRIHSFVALKYRPKTVCPGRPVPGPDLQWRRPRRPVANFAGEFAATLIYLILRFDSAAKNTSMTTEFIG